MWFILSSYPGSLYVCSMDCILFDRIFKHREESWKYDAQRSIFEELRGVWRCGQTFSWVLDVIYQTWETVFHRDNQTSRRELKMRRAAKYFWRNSRCLDSRWNIVSSVWCTMYLRNRKKTQGVNEEVKSSKSMLS